MIFCLCLAFNQSETELFSISSLYLWSVGCQSVCKKLFSKYTANIGKYDNLGSTHVFTFRMAESKLFEIVFLLWSLCGIEGEYQSSTLTFQSDKKFFRIMFQGQFMETSQSSCNLKDRVKHATYGLFWVECCGYILSPIDKHFFVFKYPTSLYVWYWTGQSMICRNSFWAVSFSLASCS